MNDKLITQNEITQAMSQLLLDVATGRNVNKSQLEKMIAASDATVRKMQSQVNTVKVMIECKKHGIDFAAAMQEVRALDRETLSEFQIMLDKPFGE